MMNETKKNMETLDTDAMEQVSGGLEIVGGKAVSSAGCSCGSAPGEMVFNAATYDPGTGKTRFRFVCAKCGKPLNFYRTGDLTGSIRP